MYRAEACFSYHHTNAYEDDEGRIVLVARAVYPDEECEEEEGRGWAAAIVKVFLSLLLWAHLCACLWTLQTDLADNNAYDTDATVLSGLAPPPDAAPLRPPPTCHRTRQLSRPLTRREF